MFMGQHYTRHEFQPVSLGAAMGGGVSVVPTRLPVAGMIVPQHAHSRAHLSYVATGAVRVWADDAPLGDFHAPAGVMIPAFVHHRFETLADDTLILCIFAGEDECDACGRCKGALDAVQLEGVQ